MIGPYMAAAVRQEATKHTRAQGARKSNNVLKWPTGMRLGRNYHLSSQKINSLQPFACLERSGMKSQKHGPPWKRYAAVRFFGFLAGCFLNVAPRAVGFLLGRAFFFSFCSD